MNLDTTAARLSSLLESMEWDEVRAVVDRLVLDLATDPPGTLDPAWQSILGGLRRKRLFAQLERVSAGLLGAGLHAPFVIRQHAQALIELGRGSEAEGELRNLVDDPSTAPPDRDEAHGQLGRIFKQRFTSDGDPTSLHHALHEYWAVYAGNPDSLWHGVNVAALLVRAREDGIAVNSRYPSAEQLAEKILERLDQSDATEHARAATRERPPWELAIRLEALLVLGRDDEALATAARYKATPGVDAFELAATERQLRAVWGLDQRPDGPARQLMATLDEARATALGGETLPDQASSAVPGVDHNRPAVVFKGGVPRTRAVAWLQRALECCRAVARIEGADGRGVGTGWMVRGSDLVERWGEGPVLVTAKIVLSPSEPSDSKSGAFVHALEPSHATVFFEFAQERVAVAEVLWSSTGLELDATVARLAHVPEGVTTLRLGPLARLMPDESSRVYIIGHPGGRGLELSLHDNLLLAADARRLHYRAYTEGGSAGSPVFDDQWRVVATHHAGGLLARLHGTGTYEANEGIAIQAIRRAARTRTFEQERELKAEVRQHLSALDTTFSAGPAAKSRYSPWHRAAALLWTFDDDLPPLDTPREDETFEDVLADSELVAGAGGQSRYQLRSEIRREVLRELAADGLLAAAAATVPETGEVRQRLLKQYIAGTSPPLEKQSTGELTASFDVVSWLAGIVSGVPTPAEVQARLDLASLLKPFEDLAAHFRGRTTELNTLRDYVGVLPPTTSWSWLQRRARDILDWHEKPPLVIYGTGGVGKSTLIGQFILEHARLGDDKRFPFAYLDFDRPDLVPSEPLTILVEAVRQIGIEWPEVQADCERLRARWNRQRGREPQSPATQPANDAHERARFISDFAALLATKRLADRPLLLVIDTFEQVQVRSQAFVRDICGFLRDLQAAAPRLRTVFCGRAPVDGVKTQPLPLLHLDAEAARGFLEGLGLKGETAARVAARVGGNPLALHMARDLLRKLQRESSDTEGLIRFEREVAGFGSNPDVLQRLLYDRILAHVIDEDVGRLAHPGLVLRRVTPALITEVLAGPCEISAAAARDPRGLLERMTSEVWLVLPSGIDEVRHRPDVRKLMLPSMAADARLGPKLDQIQKGAIAFYASAYERSHDLADRAEEIYHRLLSGQPATTVEPRWVAGVERFLLGAVDDLPPVQRAWLSVRLQIELDPVARSSASLEEWERDAARRVGQLLASADTAAAAAVLRERQARSDDSPLFLLEARVVEAEGNLEGAAEVLGDALARAFQSGARTLWRELAINLAALEARLERATAAARRLDEAAESAAHAEDRLAALRIELIRLDLVRATTTPAGTVPPEPETVGAIEKLLLDLSDEELALDLAATRRATGETGAAHPDLVRRVLRIAGLGTPVATDLAALGVALEAWDRALLTRGQQGAPPPPNAAALVRVLERGFSGDEVVAIYQDRVEPRLKESGVGAVVTVEELRSSPSAGRRLVEVLERAGSLDLLAEAIEQQRPGAAAPARKSLGPIARRVDLLNYSEDGTLESFALTAVTALAPTLEHLWAEFTVPDAVRTAVARILRRPPRPAQPAAVRPPVGSPPSRAVAVTLSEAQRKRLHHALINAFPTYETVRQVIYFALNTNIEAIAPVGSLADTTLQLIRWAEARGTISQLVTAALRAQPRNAALHAVADDLGLTASFISADDLVALTRAVRETGSHDVVAWRQACVEMAGRVCRVDLETPAVHGTGFLIARDLMMTAYSVVSQLVERSTDRPAITALFDYRAVEGEEVDPGLRVGVASDWLVAHDAGLDFAVLRLDRPVADEPVGGDRALPNAPPRGWLALPSRRPEAFSGLVVILQHPRAGPLKVAFDPAAASDDSGAFVQYRANTEAGSAGAPCFSADWDLVAMHQGRAPTLTQWTLKQGIAIDRVAERLSSLVVAAR